MDRTRINNQISAPELRIIGSDGENVGVMTRDAALAKAKEEGLDLIEIAPHATPPVARIMSFDKYRYERDKLMKKERQSQKGGGLKQVQISVRAAKNDLLVKLKKLEEFLAEGHPVEIKLRWRGREKAHPDWAKQKMREFQGMITTDYKVMSDIRPAGNGFGMTIIKK